MWLWAPWPEAGRIRAEFIGRIAQALESGAQLAQPKAVLKIGGDGKISYASSAG